jgi:small subunit ribosomal protein S27Ae
MVFVRTDRTHVLELGSTATVADVKAAIEARQGVPAEEQRVMFAGRQLEEDARLDACGVTDDSQLYVLMRLLGGAKKRKKKTYTKPKKQKHKHKKVKLRVLKFYKVDDSGKVQRLRKVCPQCGPGIFMATHFNRVYCGKCHLTYVYDKEGQTT